AELAVGPALVDREAELARRALRMALASRPLRRPAHGLLELAAREARRRHLVEAHRDVAAEVALDRRRALRRDAARGAVVHVAERDAVVVDREQRVAEREDLEAARVGEDRPVPAHEAV